MIRPHAILVWLVLIAAPAAAQVTGDVPAARPDALVDLASREGTESVKGAWRYSDTRIVEVAHHAVGADLKPSGPADARVHVEPHAGAADYDDGSWEALDPTSLEARRSKGRLAFSWYRHQRHDPGEGRGVRRGRLDDGLRDRRGRLRGSLGGWAAAAVLGQAGGAAIKGWNTPNRVVVARNARPGQRIQLAVFAANGPVSEPPGNFIWIRSATLQFYRQAASAPSSPSLRTSAVDPALDRVVPARRAHRGVADGLRFHRRTGLVARRATCSSAIRTRTRIYRWTPKAKSPSTGPRAATPAWTSASTGSRDRTGSPWIARAGSRSTSTATAA